MRYLKILVMAMLLSVCLPAAAQMQCGTTDSVARARAVEYYYLQARSYMEQDSIDRCFEILEHCHALDSSSLTVMYDLSSFYAFFKKDSVVHDMLKRIVSADPSNVYYSRALVNYYVNVGNIDAAIKVYETLLDKVHSKSEIYMYLFSLYSEAGQYEKAIDVLNKLERIEGPNEDFIVNKVRLYMQLGDSAKAVAVVSDMIEEYPYELRYLTLLGNTYVALGNRDKALEAYEKVLSVNPDDLYTLASLSELYLNYGNDSLYCDNIEHFLKCEALDAQSRVNTLLQYIEIMHPKDSARVTGFMREMYNLPYDELDVATLYSHYLTFIKAPSDTIAPVLEKIVSLEPDNLTVIIRLLEYAIEKEDMEAIFKYSDNAQPYCPDKLEIYYYKGLASYMLDRKAESIEIYKEGLEKRADDTEPKLVSAVYALIGDTYHDLNMMDKCMEAYDSALVYDNANVGVLNNYAYFLALDNKELNRALEMSQATISMTPDDPTCIDTYAWVLFKLGRYEEAKAYAEKLLSIGSEQSSVVYHHCGDIYAKCGNMEQAVNYWIMARDAGEKSKILDKKIKKRKYYAEAKRK